jgi:hypothetical protein
MREEKYSIDENNNQLENGKYKSITLEDKNVGMAVSISKIYY